MTKKKKQPSRGKANKSQNAGAPHSLRTSGLFWAGGFVGVALAVAYFLSASPQSSDVRRLTSAGKYTIPCSESSDNLDGCLPRSCGRIIADSFATEKEIASLVRLMDTGMSVGEAAGPPSILDFASGAVSHGTRFLNVFEKLQSLGSGFQHDDLRVLQTLIERIREFVQERFNSEGLMLTSPMFFSRIRGDVPAKTLNDEYWHPHVDTLQYGSFVYTGLLYLNTQGEEYEGGDFQFLDEDSNMTVAPQAGRLVAFTSGAENVHHVTPVSRGLRRALTIAFTCDPTREVVQILDKAFALNPAS